MGSTRKCAGCEILKDQLRSVWEELHRVQDAQAKERAEWLTTTLQTRAAAPAKKGPMTAEESFGALADEVALGAGEGGDPDNKLEEDAQAFLSEFARRFTALHAGPLFGIVSEQEDGSVKLTTGGNDLASGDLQQSGFESS